VPTWTAPGPKFNGKKAKGKSIFIIPETSTVPFLTQLDSSIVAIAKKAHLKTTVWSNNGSPSQWVAGINQAVAQKVNLIVLGAPPDILQPQLAKAQSAHIPVVVLHLYDRTMPHPKRVTAYVDAPFTLSGRLEADWAIKDTKGKASALIVTSNDVPPSPYIVKAMQAEFKTRCPKCKTYVLNVASTDWATKMQGSVQSSLTAHPDINYVIPLYDSASEFVAPAIVAVHKKGKVKIASYNNTPFVLKMLEDHDIVAMDVGESVDWLAYSNMDQVMRILAGVKPLKHETSPVRVFTAANVKQTGVPPTGAKGFGSKYQGSFTKLWGL
jgi:ribose transport system substrate-binding protein